MNKLLAPSCIIAGGLVLSALILKSDVLADAFYTPPGPGYQKVANQFKAQMESGMKSRIFVKSQLWKDVEVNSVTFEKRSKSYRVYYAINLRDLTTKKDYRYESNCPLSPSVSDKFVGLCSRLYDPQSGELGSGIQVSVR